MADGLKLSQLAGLFAGMAQGPATFNPAQKVFTDYLSGSAQSAIMAESQKKAEKKAKKKSSGIGGLLGAAGSIVAAPFTGGASLAYLPTAMAAGSAVDSAVAGDVGGVVTNTANAAGSGYGAAKAAGPSPNAAFQQVPIAGGPVAAPMSNMFGSPQADPFGLGGSYGGAGKLPRAIAAPTPSPPSPFQNMFSSPAASNPVADMFQPAASSEGEGEMIRSIAAAKPNTAKADVWENTSGGVANRQAVTQFAGMKPREIRQAINTNPAAEQALIQYLNAGGQLTHKQMRALPPSTKQTVRTYGYQMPGPFGMREF